MTNVNNILAEITAIEADLINRAQVMSEWEFRTKLTRIKTLGHVIYHKSPEDTVSANYERKMSWQSCKNIATGETFRTIRDAAASINVNERDLGLMLRNKILNTTQIISINP